jgi:hypothetical protein
MYGFRGLIETAESLDTAEAFAKMNIGSQLAKTNTYVNITYLVTAIRKF